MMNLNKHFNKYIHKKTKKNMVNNNYPVDIPKTFTVSYYNPETDQNLTAEEWKQLNPEVNPSEVKIINKGEVYRSWKVNSDNPAYGPGFWDDFLKPTLTGVLTVAAVFPPTAAIAAPIAAGVALTGGAIMGIGHAAEDEKLKDFGKGLFAVGFDSFENQESIDKAKTDLGYRYRNN